MKALLLLFILFLSCDTQHECVTVTILDGEKTVDVWDVDMVDVERYDDQVIFFTVNIDGEIKHGSMVTDCK